MLPVNFVRIHIISKKRSPQIHIPIEMNQTVELLKEKIYEKTRIKETSQILKFKKDKDITVLKGSETLESYGISSNSVITLKKYYLDESEEDEELAEVQVEVDSQKMGINERIDFYGNLTRQKKNYEMLVIEEEKHDDFGGDDEENNLILFQKKFLVFARKNIKNQTNTIVDQMSKLSKQIQKEVVEFQSETGLTSLHYLIENKMDYILSFLIKQLDEWLLDIEGENCPSPLVFAVMKVLLVSVAYRLARIR